MATATPYGQVGVYLASGRIDWMGDAIKVLLTDATYKPNRSQSFRSDVKGVLAGSEVALAGKSREYDPATETTTLGADDPSWGPSVSLAPRYAVYFKSQGDARKDELICWCDLGPNVYVANGTLTLKLSDGGVLKITG